MKVYTFDGPLMSLVDLNDMLRPKIIEFYLFVVRTGGDAISKGVKFDLVDDACVLLVGLDGLFGYWVPDVDQFVVAGDDVGGGW